MTPSPTQASLITELSTTPHPGRWISISARPAKAARRKLNDLTASELLARSLTDLPPNLRYTRIGGAVGICGEFRLTEDEDYEQAEERLRFQLADLPGPAAANDPDPATGRVDGLTSETIDEAIEASLDAMQASWTRRDETWAVAAQRTAEFEAIVRADRGGAWVECVLLHRDDGFPDPSHEAISQFLLQASAQLRLTRFEWDSQRILVRSFAGLNTLSDELPNSIQAVGHARSRLGREIRALMIPEIATAYLA